MADLLLVHFALIPGPVRKKGSSAYLTTFLDWTLLFPHGRAISGIRKMFYTTRTEQEISTFPLSDVKVVAY